MATPGNAQVTLSWNTVAGATSYSVKRSTVNGGPYSSLAIPTSNSYIDTTAVNGTTYYYVVSAVNAGGESINSAQVSATPQNPVPAAPTGLTATAGNGQIALIWNAVTGATGYNVKRSTTFGSGYTTVASNLTTTNYTDTSVTNGITYYYVVTALDTYGEGANSNQASATPVAPPATPTNLTATPGSNKVTLAWTASTGAANYEVKRSTTMGGPYSALATTSASSFVDNSAVNGTTYYYVVSAKNNGGQSGDSNVASATPEVPPAPTEAPTLYGYFQPNYGNTTEGHIRLTWSAVSGATRYNVKRSGSATGPFYTVATVTDTAYMWYVFGGSGQTYYFMVSAVNDGGEGPNSNVVQVTTGSGGGSVSPTPTPTPTATPTPTPTATPTPTPIVAPGVPTGLTAVPGNAQVALSWDAVAGATSYKVKYSTHNPIGTFATGVTYTYNFTTTATNYTVTNLTNDQPYKFTVSAVNAGGEGNDAPEVIATPGAAPAAPTNLTASGNDQMVTLNWTASTGATSYKVYRSMTSGTGFVQIGNPTSTTFTDIGLINSETYYYVVTALKRTFESPPSDQEEVTVGPLAVTTKWDYADNVFAQRVLFASSNTSDNFQNFKYVYFPSDTNVTSMTIAFSAWDLKPPSVPYSTYWRIGVQDTTGWADLSTYGMVVANSDPTKEYSIVAHRNSSSCYALLQGRNLQQSTPAPDEVTVSKTFDFKVRFHDSIPTNAPDLAITNPSNNQKMSAWPVMTCLTGDQPLPSIAGWAKDLTGTGIEKIDLVLLWKDQKLFWNETAWSSDKKSISTKICSTVNGVTYWMRHGGLPIT